MWKHRAFTPCTPATIRLGRFSCALVSFIASPPHFPPRSRSNRTLYPPWGTSRQSVEKPIAYQRQREEGRPMNDSHSDALVFYGATGDLAYKKIFPALHAMVKRGHLDVPVIGVAKAGWTLEQLRARARESIEHHGGTDPAAFEKLCLLLRYVDGDYQAPATFEAVRKEL